jgi:phosphoglycerate dehydrogenase-like enzyme
MSTILLQIDPERISANTRRNLESAAAGHALWFSESPAAEAPGRLEDVEITAGWRVPEALLYSSRLRWHHQLSAGIDWLMQIEDREALPFEITNVSGMHASQMAEHAFAMLFSLSRGFVHYIRNQPDRKWDRLDTARMMDLGGKTMLVVGAGAIGTHVAAMAKAHGMTVIGIRRNPDKPNVAFDRMHGLDELDNLLPDSSVVVLSLPTTPGTGNLFSKRQFSLMPRNGILINIGRGSHVDEAALAEALQSGHLHGAGCDAFATEPLPETSPLWELDNMIISPHCAGAVHDYLDRALATFIENLRNRAVGRPMINLIDKHLGY